MTNMYETWLMEQIHSIANFPYEDIKILDKYPLDVSKQVLKVLIAVSYTHLTLPTIRLV